MKTILNKVDLSASMNYSLSVKYKKNILLKIALFIIVVAACNLKLNSQPDIRTFETPKQNIIPGNNLFVSPEVKSFHQYNIIPVNLYTGKVQISIPIFEIKAKNFTVPISLSYNSKGIEVNEYAPNVGTGWILNAGGSVIRIVQDLDDDQLKSVDYYLNNNTATTPRLRVSEMGYNRSLNGLGNGFVIIDKVDNGIHYDTSPDIYYANAPGLFSKFYLNFNETEKKYNPQLLSGKGHLITANRVEEPLNTPDLKDKKGFKRLYTSAFNLYPDEANRLHEYNDNYVPVKSFDFSIINMEGVQYNFKEKDLSESITDFNGITIPPEDDFEFPWYMKCNDYRVSSNVSHLSSIVDPSSNSQVDFLYSSEIDTTIISYDRSYYHANISYNVGREYKDIDYEDFSTLGAYQGIDGDTIFWENADLGQDVNYKKQFSKNLKKNNIKKILWDGGSIEFNYDLPRIDYCNKALTSIVVRDKNDNLIKQMNLYYSYFLTTSDKPNKEAYRLRLDKIGEVSTDLKDEIFYRFEYDCSEPLPPVSTGESDYLGYYNKKTNNKFRTQLYYHYNKGRYSFLPFPLTEEYIVVPKGSRSQEGNSASLLGLLNRIVYPTGGTSEFIYENHQFKLFDKNVTAGGVRIKKQTLKDEQGNTQIKEYSYLLEDSSSSGSICNMPQFAVISKCLSNRIRVRCFNRNISSIELTEGSFVGYSRIIENDMQTGYKEYLYSSPSDYPNDYLDAPSEGNIINFLKNNSSYPGTTHSDNDIFRGKLLRERVFNSSKKLIEETTYNYTLNTRNEYFKSQIILHKFPIGGLNNIGSSISCLQKIEGGTSLLSNKTIRKYFDDFLTSESYGYSYDDTYPILKEFSSKNSNGDEIKKEYKYSYNFIAQNILYRQMSDKNILSPIIYEITTINNKEVNRRYVEYNCDANKTKGMMLPSYQQTSTGGDLRTDAIFDLYDTKGNLLQYTSLDGLKTCYLWSHVGQYPIAKIVNASYEEIKTALGITPETISIQTMPDMQKINALREKLPNAQVSTYTYKPLVGMTSMTDPRGGTTTYEYDSFGRLSKVKDTNGKVINTYDYHYQRPLSLTPIINP